MQHISFFQKHQLFFAPLAKNQVSLLPQKEQKKMEG